MSPTVISCKSAEESSSESEYGRVVELVDSLDSGSSVHCGRAGSSPASPTKKDIRKDVFFLYQNTIKYFHKNRKSQLTNGVVCDIIQKR